MWKIYFIIIVGHLFSNSVQAIEKPNNSIDLYRYGYFVEAEQQFQQQRQDPAKELTALLYLGRIAINHYDNFELAMEYFNEAKKIAPTHHEIPYYQGVAYAIQIVESGIFSAPKYIKLTESSFRESLALKPNHIPGYEALITFYLEVPGFLGGDEEKALELIETLRRYSPLKADLNLIDYYFAEEEEEKAGTLIEQLLNEYSTIPEPWYAEGLIYRETGDFAGAVNSFSRCSEQQAQDPEQEMIIKACRIAAARAALKGKIYTGTIANLLTEYIQHPIPYGLPTLAHAEYTFGEWYEDQERLSDAVRYYQQAKDHTDNKKLMKKAHRKVERLSRRLKIDSSL